MLNTNLERLLNAAADEHYPVLDYQEVRKGAPAIFAEAPSSSRSDSYRFVPTYQVLEAMVKEGFYPTKVAQKKGRTPETTETNRHMVRLRHKSYIGMVGEDIPELVLSNAHDGTACYNLMAGVFRMVCSNGLIVSTMDIGAVHIRHAGPEELVHDVLEASYKIIEETPTIMKRIADFKLISLNRTQQVAFAHEAAAFRKTKLALDIEALLKARRREDAREEDGRRSLWTTYNTIQEKLIKGQRFIGSRENGRIGSLRELQNVQEDISINRSLWELAEKTAKQLCPA